ncbi:hypothetical protein [Paenibacillus herberti]|uniref:Uncharacterized protein n=1 Tax=Paenibacillus herberti TaxID=1619309 RepID=A0A229NVR0_9BACL|nr:hypothetical protein [Paenibacillus herberti]OXM13940.1 hypothetical protein CGZ75_13085 [Paenibacillus herberti]
MIQNILQYYIDYENTMRFAQSSLADRCEGEYYNRGIVKQGSLLYSDMQSKKIRLIQKRLLHLLNFKGSEMQKNLTSLLNDLVPSFLDGTMDVDTFLQTLNVNSHPNERAMRTFLGEIIQNDQLTLCYPLLTKVVKNKKIVHPLIVFTCRLNQDDTLHVEKFTISREALTIVAAYCDDQSHMDTETVKSKEITEVLHALRDCKQSNIDEILKILYRELNIKFDQREPSFLENPKYFKPFEGWRMLEQAFVTLDWFGDLIEPIFRKELHRVKNRMESLPSNLLKKYLAGDDNSQLFESCEQAEADLFHWGSYTDQYPLTRNNGRLLAEEKNQNCFR